MNAHKDSRPDDVRFAILGAAIKRFNQFGYNKTTMAEIAKDCQMSAANLYRYFENKLDIGANLACQCLDTETGFLQDIVSQSEQSAAVRLKIFVLAILKNTYTQWSETPLMNEMVMAICHERQDIVDRHMEEKQALLIELLQQGNDSGEMDIGDLPGTAEAILSATILFDVPIFMPMFSYENIQRKAERVIELLLKGLLKR